MLEVIFLYDIFVLDKICGVVFWLVVFNEFEFKFIYRSL